MKSIITKLNFRAVWGICALFLSISTVAWAISVSTSAGGGGIESCDFLFGLDLRAKYGRAK